ncbi:MAG: aminopeptidase [Clostridia bacterium]|nr:aminopeptidase [Clostridia bacterium]
MDLNEIKYEKKTAIESLSKVEQDSMFVYANEYIKFLNYAKTEYKCVELAVRELEEAGFRNILEMEKLETGSKVYFVNKERALFIAIIGSEDLQKGLNIIGAHIDSPRLDTKPMPLFEKQNIAMMKTQYYGGIKKYQWLTIPLSMYAVIYNKKGEKIDIVVGEEYGDPVFTITDLLPHLAREEMQKKASEFIDAENLSVIVGGFKDKATDTESVKANILKILNKKYGITEIDFARSDIRFVPNFKASFVGFDKAMIAGYGQDDRVCSYAVLASLLNISKEDKVYPRTMVGLLVDKEEIGSEGSTSMSSSAFELFVNILFEKTNSSNSGYAVLNALNNSYMLSADVSAAVDPMHEGLSDIQNANLLGSGISIEKYTGSGGKYSANDASAKYMSKVMSLFDKSQITYQMGTLGKIDKGGGGTIAYILANKGVEVVDCGTALLSMHSPYELSNTADVYMTYKAYKSFFKDIK